MTSAYCISHLSTYYKNIINIYGEDEGKKWLEHLPNLIGEIAEKYNLSDLKPVDNLSFNYVLSGFQSTKPIILKISCNTEAIKHEAYAIRAFDSHGGVKMVAEEEGMLLLEKALPGISLKSYFPDKDQEAIEITCNLIKKLHKASLPKSNQFPNIKDWLKALDQDWNMPPNYIHKARTLRDKLLSNSSKPVLLHGDLHHDNILKNANSWIAIDPKGVRGEQAFEVAAFIRNPIPELLLYKNAKDLIQRRISLFASLLDIPSQLILDCSYILSVLSWIWAIEDNSNCDYFHQIVEFLYNIDE